MVKTLFHPAPQGLPVPVRPPQGKDSVRQEILQSDWKKSCNLSDDSLVRAGALWLYGFLDDSHQIVQQDSSAEASYWHALMHRSEGDFSNSMYWFRKVGRHPVYATLHQEARKLEGFSQSSRESLELLLKDSQWNSRTCVKLPLREHSRT